MRVDVSFGTLDWTCVVDFALVDAKRRACDITAAEITTGRDILVGRFKGVMSLMVTGGELAFKSFGC